VFEFAQLLRAARQAAGLTQVALAQRSGLARPNIAAYEHGRREPLFATAMALLDAVGAQVDIEPPVAWSWTTGRRPYAVPSCLWRLPSGAALSSFNPAVHLWWSGPPRAFDMSLRSDRLRAYEIVLREGRPDDIEAIVDGVLLCEAWPDLVLPRELRSAWERLIAAQLDPAPLAQVS
jgi:transcriptional regulator with XRE-family HTH domain